MSEENRALMRRFYEEVMNEGNLAAIDELCAPGFIDHSPSPGQAPGAEGLKQAFAAMGSAFRDIRVTVDHMVAEGDTVAAHITFRGTQTRELMGIPPSGREAVLRVSDIVRFAGGKAVERWGVEDMSGLLAPPPGAR